MLMRFAGPVSILICLLGGVGLLGADSTWLSVWTAPVFLVTAGVVSVTMALRLLGGTRLTHLRIVETLAMRVVIPAIFGFLAVVFYDHLETQHWLDFLQFRPDRDADGLLLEIFNGTVSSIYALIVAFMVFKSMQDHDNINIILRDEAMHLDSISQFLPYFRRSENSANLDILWRIHNGLKSYAENICSTAFKQQSGMKENQEIIDAVIADIGELKLDDAHDQMTLDHIIKRIDSLSSVRAKRIAYMMAKQSPFMIIMLLVLSFFIVAPFFVAGGQGMGVDADASPVLTGAILWFLAFSLTFLYLMMVDMAEHFEGYWEVKRDGFKDVAKRINTRLERLEQVRAARSADSA